MKFGYITMTRGQNSTVNRVGQSSSPRPQKLKVKIFASIFSDQRGNLRIYYLPRDHTIKA